MDTFECDVLWSDRLFCIPCDGASRQQRYGPGRCRCAYDGLSVTHRRRALYLCVTDLVANIALSGI
jgi:hypothetical protein